MTCCANVACFLLLSGLAAGDPGRTAPDHRSTAPASHAPYSPLQPGMMAAYETSGEHGVETERERRQLSGKLWLASYEADGEWRIVSVYQPGDPAVLAGCPVQFARVANDTRVVRLPELLAPIACEFVLDALCPRQLVPTDARVTDEFTEVLALSGRIPAHLKVQTLSDPGGGWMRTESLARPSEEASFAAGTGRLTEWETRYVLDRQGMVTLADQRFKANIPEQRNITIAVHVNVARRSLEPLSPAQAGRIARDVVELKQIARDWRMERGLSLKRLDALMTDAKNSAFGPLLPWVKTHLQAEIKHYGEKTPPFYWHPPEMKTAPQKPKKKKD